MAKGWVFVGALLLVGACAQHSQPVTSSDPSDREYELLRALLKDEWGEALVPVFVGLVTDQGCIEDLDGVREQLQNSNPLLVSFPDDLFESFQLVCAYQSHLDAKRLGLPISNIRSETAEPLDPKAIWVSVSRVGFSQDGNLALLEVSSGDDEFGSGEWVVVQRVRGRWRVVADAWSWLS